MSLANEVDLRQSLDALFYRDTIKSRLKSIDNKSLEEKIPRNNSESMNDYLDRVCDYLSDYFGGYSISHVSGRYRADSLKSIKEVFGDTSSLYSKYLIDETTAIVRFIFPCGKPNETKFLSSKNYFDDITNDYEEPTEETKKQAALIRWFFYVLFVQSIVQVVNGEDEIWMQESGMRNRLHIWRIKDN